MVEQTDSEREMAQLLVSTLELEDVDAAEIVPSAPLFGQEPDSLGLDSIDALEIALAVNQSYGVELRADDEQNSQIFATLKALTGYVQAAKSENA
ncbi:MAG: phosphopantetheine-binding protein [Sinobacteraceae bacterium]|nr:phosphopantetheine-binding protein [Nevskiaceae bacterium]